MSRLILTVLALTAAAACAAGATTLNTGPSESAIVAQTSERLAQASSELGVPPAEAPASAPVAPSAQLAAAPIVAAAEANLRCEVHATPTPDGVRLTAVAISSAPTSGAYELIVTKSGSDGSSDISQSGEFDTVGGPSADLGTAEIGLEPGARFHARLSVTGNDGVTCRDELSS